MSLALLFHYLLFNMFQMLIQPSSGACDVFVELFHGLYCSGLMCVGVTLRFGGGGVVSICRLKHWGFHPQQILEAAAAQTQGEEASADYTTVIPPALALIYLPLPQPVMHLPAHFRSLAFHWLLHQPARTLSGINTPHIPSLVILHPPAYEDGTDGVF